MENSRFRYGIKTYMPCKYTDKSDLQHRVNNSLVTYNGVIYYAQLGNSNTPPSRLMWWLCNPLDGNKSLTVEINDPKLDISALECGYYTDLQFRRAFYMIRHPSKRYTQSFSSQNVQRRTIDNSPGGGWEMLGNPGLLASLYGQYPQLEKGIELFSKGFQSVALSRDFAIQKTSLGLIMIFHKTVEIGYLNEFGRLILPEKNLTWIVRNEIREIFHQ